MLLAVVCLTTGFALIRPAFGFIAFGLICAGLAFFGKH